MTMIDSRYRADTAHRAGPREWLALAVLMLPVLLTSIDNTVLSFALPQVSSALHPGSTAGTAKPTSSRSPCRSLG